MTVDKLIEELKKLNSPKAEVSVDLFDDGGGNEAGMTHPGEVRSVRMDGPGNLFAFVSSRLCCSFHPPKGYRLALLLIQLRKRIYGPVAFGILRHRPNPEHRPASAFERAYHRIDTAFDEAISLLVA
jgi:hypothetical protein